MELNLDVIEIKIVGVGVIIPAEKEEESEVNSTDTAPTQAS